MPIEVYLPEEGATMTPNTSSTYNLNVAAIQNTSGLFTLIANDFTANTIIQIKTEDADGVTHMHLFFAEDNNNGQFDAVVNSLATNIVTATATIQSDTAIIVTALSLVAPIDPLITSANAIPKTLSYQNSSVLTVEQDAVGLCSLSITISATTDITGFVIFTYTATDNASVLTLNVLTDSTEENYSPLLLSVTSGQHTTAIPIAFLSKTTGAFEFHILASVNTGTLTIETNKLVYTLTGSNITYTND